MYILRIYTDYETVESEKRVRLSERKRRGRAAKQ